jgi:threonine/homoserine/homoserine lactone efflux protein
MAFKENDEIYRVVLASAGGFSAMFTKIDIILKVLIGAATLFYLCLKIKKELSNAKNKSSH